MKSIFTALAAALPTLLACTASHAATTSFNTGSLGPSANGTNGDTTVLGQPGAVSAGGDLSVGYGAGSNTTIPFQAGLNPGAGTAFSIEFWARPSSFDNDDVPLTNRFAPSVGNRSGWTFFQRTGATGWNFRMYSGAGSGLGWDLTGGTSTLDTWSHVVATWNGSVALLYVNGALADSTNDGGASGVYTANVAGNAPIMSLGANFDGSSSFTGRVDEVAFYNSALNLGQIQNHFSTASSAVPGAYHAMVLADGALLQLTNIPEPTSGLLLGLGSLALLRRRARSR